MDVFEGSTQQFIPRGVKRTVEAMRKPSIRPTTTMQIMTEPKRHQLITRRTPPTTPITADKARRTVWRKQETDNTQEEGFIFGMKCSDCVLFDSTVGGTKVPS